MAESNRDGQASSREAEYLAEMIDESTYRNANPERESILMEAERIVNGSRNNDYGDSNENIRRIVSIANAMGVDIDSVDFCKVMIAVKLGRLMHRYKRDSVADLAGYAELWSRLEEA